jgi:hypothetical protein
MRRGDEGKHVTPFHAISAHEAMSRFTQARLEHQAGESIGWEGVIR